MKAVLRLELPRLDALAPDAILAFTIIEAGRVTRSGELTANAIATTAPVLPVVAVLHPADATLAQVRLPPVPGHRLQEALAGAIEPLILGDVDTLALAHGPRGADGATPVAWALRRPLGDAWRQLADAGLPVEALVPAPLALPLPAPGTITLMLHDGYLLYRTSRDEGQTLALDPIGPQDASDASAQAWLRLLWQQHPGATAVWVGAVPTGWQAAFADDAVPATQVVPVAQHAAAVLPGWSLAVASLRPPRLQRSAWRRPLAWVAAAAAVWALGLNVHAMRLQAEAAELNQRMVNNVKATFPTLPVVLDPLRQATQQRDALRSAAGDVTDTDFLPLALGASQLLPMSANNVAAVGFADGTLTLRLIENPPGASGALDPAIATRARELALQVDQRDGAWLIRRQDDGTPPDAGTGSSVRIQPSAAPQPPPGNRLRGDRT